MLLVLLRHFLMPKLMTPISHLFEDAVVAERIAAASDGLECRDRSINSTMKKQYLFHCELQPIHQWGEKEYAYLQRIADQKPDLQLLTLHIASNCTQPYVQAGMFQPGGKTYTRAEMLANAKVNFSRLKAIFGADVDIAVENNNFYPTPAYDDVTEAKFISQVVDENDLNFLFDVAHAKVTCYNKNISFERYKRALPLHKMLQIHICTYGIRPDGSSAYDAHNPPDSEELLEVRRLIQAYPQVKYLTVEYYRDVDGLCRSLDAVRGLL